jgi:hypothetical protein
LFSIGDIVTHAEIYHRRGASKGAIKLITAQGWYQVWWEEDGDFQIHPAARTFEFSELKLWKSQNLSI